MINDEIFQTPSSTMETFDRINVDKSGSLNKQEIAMVLKSVTDDVVNGFR